ncbi:MAG: rhomboid family intramembrane serine protease [Pseudomonadales bacterium]
MLKALELPIDIDLAAFSAYLDDSGLAHRIAEEGGRQMLWVPGEREAALVQQLYQRFESGELRLTQGAPLVGAADSSDAAGAGDAAGSSDAAGASNTAGASQLGRHLYAALVSAPLTMGLVITTIAFFPATFGALEGDYSAALLLMTFVPVEFIAGQAYFLKLGAVADQGEWWRLLSPMFLHFGSVHLVFNLLWVWEIGRRIEMVNGWGWLLALTLVSSLAANLAQYLMAELSLFGGMSGVVFGMLGHALVFSRLNPSRSLGLPTGIYIFMLLYLALGFTGLIDLFGLSLANGAHLGGLIAGLLTGCLAGLPARQGSRQER